jgi:endogenous inhibitor of DNA gyrase (YacG/DUF329 family)
VKEVRCPNCGKPVAWRAESRWRPFCSERCRLVDLGAWFTGERAIPAEETPAPAGERDNGEED